MGDDDDDHQPKGKKLAQDEAAAGATMNIKDETDEEYQDDDGRNLDLGRTSILEFASNEEGRLGLLSYLENQCTCNSPQCKQLVLSRELDNIFNPKIWNLLDLELPGYLDRIWPLITQRLSAEISSYLKLLAEYKPERYCSLTWPPNYVAFRCRTCSNSSTMSLCTDCFRGGNHEGHDYNMFKSRSGGACDCGFLIMKESGHCKKHGTNAIAKRSHEQVPEHLICVPKRSMPRLIHRLTIQLRRSLVDLNGGTDIYLDYLSQMASSNAIIRGLMIDALISDQAYSSQIQQLCNHPDKDVLRIISTGLKKLKSEIKGLKPFKLPWGSTNKAKNIKAFSDNLVISCFLDELVFWMVVYEFPQKLVCFLLSFLMDEKYKQVFARDFVGHYPRIVMLLASLRGEPRRQLRDSYELLSRRILQVSVQIYCDANLTRILCEEEHTLHVLIYCLRVAIEGSPSDELNGVLKFNPLCLNDGSTPRVVCCDNLLIRDRHLGSFTIDLNAILDFDHEAIRLICDRDLLNTWLEMLTYFQTMSPYKRELGEHAPYETSPNISVFTIESDFCLAPLWSILSHMKVQFVTYSQALIEAIHVNLAVWFYHMRIGPNSLLDPYYMSFHIPLHRMFAATLRHMLFNQSVLDETIYNFLSDNQLILGTKYSYKTASGTPITITMNDFFKILLLHPLQALTLYHETRSNMWTRNGITTINQAVIYVHCAYCHSTVDLDMFLLKYCASKLNPNYFIKVLMSRFHAWKWLSFKSNSLMSNASNELRRLYHFNIRPEQIIQMVESSLVTLIQLLTLNLHCNISDREQTKDELISLISVTDRSYSYLVDMLPDKKAAKSRNTDDFFKSLLDELTIYKPAQHGTGGNLQQGCYTLKPNIWNEDYNPIYVQYRFYQKRDYQMSLERFFQHSKLTGNLERRYHPSSLWPPLKIPRNIGNFGQLDLSPVIECQTLVGLVFSIIYKNLYIVDVPDAIVAYAIHLLELSLRKALDKRQRTESDKDKTSGGLSNSFVGRVLYRELTSSPAYFGSKGEAFIKGSTLYSLTNNNENELPDQDDPKLFPTVKHALDLSFDTTWFPFKSIVDNCLVHVETVHSLPLKEFEIMVRHTEDSTDSLVSENQSIPVGISSSNVYGSSMSWAEVADERASEEEDIEVEDDNYDDEEIDDNEDDIDEEDDDEEDIGNFVGQLNLRPSTSSQTEIGNRQSAINNTASTINIASIDPASSGDHTYNALETTSMEVESLPETQYGALSLVPVRNQQNRGDQTTAQLSPTPSSSSSASQIYPENLVTERRAILASEPRPMIAGSVQPLILEVSSMGTHSRSRDATNSTGGGRHGSQVGGRSDGRSLSEVDIQTRFLGFFQSRLDSHRSSRGFRQRALRGRGGFRGPVPPFAVHNPNNSSPIHHSQVPPNDEPLYRAEQANHTPTNRQTASRSHASTLLNRVFSARSQQGQHQRQHQRSKRLRKDKMHHGESLLTLLLRMHAKYSQRAKSYQYNETRALTNISLKRSRIGDGVHFVTIVLDLICTLDRRMLARVEQLEKLIWCDKEDQSYNLKWSHERPSVKNDKIESSSGKMLDSKFATTILRDQRNSPYDLAGHSSWSDSLKLMGTASSSDGGNPNSCALSSTMGGGLQGHSGSSATSSMELTASERRRKAKEFQSKLMAEFASKQKAFIEKYELSSQQQAAHSKTTTFLRSDKIGETTSEMDEEPINLSSKLSQREDETKPQMTDCYKQQKQQLTQSNVDDKSSHCGQSSSKNLREAVSDTSAAYVQQPKPSITTAATATATSSSSSTTAGQCCLPTYECCICGVEGPSDLANPLGQVVLLQSTSIYGHSHMRPQSERRLPCDESDHTDLREETYAKYLERRIDLLCEHFSESSRLDSINIGAEGGVHVQSCGHYLHIECHQSYIKSLDQEDRLRSRNDSDEFLCPVCRQLANSVLPILSDIRRPGQLSLALVSSRDLDDQIKLISSLLEHRILPDQEELRSSSSFCSHLTKATGPQYRLVRSNASMHSLFLFLTSIARTNLETEVIVRSLRPSSESSNQPNQQKQIRHRDQQHQESNSSFTASKRSCFKLLFYVLALNAQTLINDQWFTCDQIWSYLTHRIDEKNCLSVKPMNSEVPLLLRDPTAMLLQFLFAITNSLCYRANFTCLVQVLFNLTVIQSVALVLSYVKPAFLFEDESRRTTTGTTSAEVRTQNESPIAKRDRTSEREERIKVENDGARDIGDATGVTTNDFQDLVISVARNLGHLLATTHPLMNSSVRYRFCWPRFSKSNRGDGSYSDGSDGSGVSGCSAESASNASISSSGDSCLSTTPPSDGDGEQIALIENRVKLACLPFLRAAALIQHHLYDQAYPNLDIFNDRLLTDDEAIEADFNTLTACLNLGENSINTSTSDNIEATVHSSCKSRMAETGVAGTIITKRVLSSSSPSTLIRALKWPSANGDAAGTSLIVSWSAELLRFGAEFSIAARTLLVGRSLAWYRPSLMQLPRSFYDIFMFYYRKKCSICNQVPKDVAICLVCGAPICFRVSCCKDRSRSRQVHSQHCGANTAVFLAVHTSSIVVIRGNRACVWGSVYLDAHDEEDNGLQRGKPLYLVQARFELLEEQWLTHSFDHTCGKRWIYLHENQ